MGIITSPPPAKLIAGLLLRDPKELKEPLFRELERAYGPTDYASDMYLFNKTDYYAREMGSPLYRLFISFVPLVEPDSLPRIKHVSNGIEGMFQNEMGGRRINIDPGLLTLQNLVLATTKNYTHRLYLGDGIYGDLTLMFQGGTYHPLPWTYPDYRDESTRHFLYKVRETYKAQLRETA